MGKASRNKGSDRSPSRSIEEARRSDGPGGGFPVFWIVVGLVCVGFVVALVVTSGGRGGADIPKEWKIEYGDVDVTGEDLAPMPRTRSGRDSAIGERIPVVSGIDLEGRRFSIDPAGAPMVIVVFAHWCPHCRREIPRIVDHLDANPLPDGVRMVGLSAAADDAKPNFPPQKWLKEVGFDAQSLRDDELGTAQMALGVESYPTLLFVGAGGELVARFSAEFDADTFDEHVREIAG